MHFFIAPYATARYAGDHQCRHSRREERMIEMFFAMTILWVFIGVLLLAIFSAPWWLTVFAIAAGILLLNKLLNPDDGAGHCEVDD
jgi:hypothetical protein